MSLFSQKIVLTECLKDLNRRNIITLILSIIIVCLIGISIYFFLHFIYNTNLDANLENFFDKETATSLYPEAVLSVHNYEQTGNKYFTLHEDPQIYVLPPKHKISSTLIEFAEPITVDSNVHIYYTRNKEKINDENAILRLLPKGSSEIIVYLPTAIYTSLRYDINIIGESFEIKGIYVSRENPRQQFFKYFSYFISSSFLTVVVIIIILIAKCVPIEYLYLVAGMGIGLLYLVLMTPLSIPDEQNHYQSTLLLANIFSLQDNRNISNSSNFGYSNLSLQNNVSSGYLRLAKEGIYQVKESEYTDIPHPYFISYYALYIPQVLGVLIARIFKMSFFGVFYLGRLTNLIFYVLCVFYAIKIVNEFKLPFFIIGLLPMSIHQAASFSYDVFINGISMIFIAYLIRILYEKKKDIIALSITGILLAPAKYIYFPIVLLVFLALPEHYGWKKAKGYIIASGIFIIGIAMIILFGHDELLKPAGQSEVLNWEGQHNYTISFIFEHPQQTVKIFQNSLINKGEYYFFSMIGQRLSGLTLFLPKWYISVFILILMASVLYSNKRSWSPKWPHRGIFLFVIISVILLCMLSMFLLYTSNFRDVIEGVQGRYLIPLIPLGMIILKSKFGIVNRLYSLVLISCVIGMQFLTIRFILESTLMF